MRHPQAVFLDFDGVILESLDVKADAMAALFADRPRHVAAIVRHHLDHAGVSRYEKFRHYYAELFREPLSDARMAELDRRFTELCDEGMRTAPFVRGADEFLRAWHARLPLFVVSGAPQRDVEAIVGRRGLGPCFRSVHGSPLRKADHLARLLAEHRLDPARCLFVGDARADLEAAAAAGIPFVQRLTAHTPRPFEPAPRAALPDLTGLAGLWTEPPRTRVALASESPLPAGAGRWLYLGRDPEAAGRWRAALGPCWLELDGARRLQQEAARLRRPYLDWVEALGRAEGADPDWWSGLTAEKNTLTDPTFAHAAGLALLRALARAGEAPDLVVVETPGMAAAAAALSEAEGLTGEAPESARHAALDWLKAAARWAEFLGGALRAALRRAPPRPAAGPRPVLVASYLHASSLGPDGRFRDRYFRGLPARLAAEGWDVWFLPTPQEPLPPRPELEAWLAASPDRFILPEDWLTAADHLDALASCVRRALSPRPAPPLDGLDMSALAAEAARREARSRESHAARLRYRLVGRLAEAGFQPALVLSWYENLRAEKALALGARRWWPAADHAGYFSVLPLPNYLPPTPLTAEREAGALPRRIVCAGAHGRDVLAAEAGAPPLAVGAALRYTHVWRAAERPTPPEPGAVLTPLPSRLDESVEVVAAVLEALPACRGLAAWRLCPHPDYAAAELLRALPPRPWPHPLTLAEEPFDALLPRSVAVVTTGSGTAVEALCAGRPVAVVGRRVGLDFDPLAYFPGAAPVCRGGAELAAALNPWLADPGAAADAAARAGRALRERCFEPESPAALRAFTESVR